MVGRGYTFSFTDEEYDRYSEWCKENHLDGYHGAIGGATSFEITPTSIGDVVVAYASVVVHDELGEVSYNKDGKIKTKRIECVIRDLE